MTIVRSEIKGPLLVAGAIFFFAAMSAMVKVAGGEVPVAEVVFFRGVFSLPILLWLVRRKKVSLRGKRPGLLLLRAFVGTGALTLLFIATVEIPVASAMVLNQTAPVFVLPMAAVFLRERIGALQVLLVLAALAGVTLIVQPTGDIVNVYGFIALASAVFSAAAYIVIRKLIETEHTLTIVTWFTLFSTIVMVPPMIPVFVLPGFKAMAALVGVGLFAMFGQLLLTTAYRYGNPGRLAVIGSMSAVFGAGFDMVIWHSIPDTTTAVGIVLVIGACATIQWRRLGKAHKTIPPG
jgi:drug/metabolite transporter (DMT)-like permease